MVYMIRHSCTQHCQNMAKEFFNSRQWGIVIWLVKVIQHLQHDMHPVILRPKTVTQRPSLKIYSIQISNIGRDKMVEN